MGAKLRGLYRHASGAPGPAAPAPALLDLLAGSLDDAWTAYTPGFAATTTPPAGFTAQGRYKQVGSLVVATINITMGATPGAGQYVIGLPVAATTFAQVVGFGRMTDVSTGAAVVGAVAQLVNAGQVSVYYSATHNGQLNAAYAAGPWAFAAGDTIALVLIYEAA